jgi:tetratricopeptide (TPR) repeat protein
LSPHDPRAAYLLGRAHLALGELDVARQKFNQAIELSYSAVAPSAYESYRYLSLVALEQGDFKTAREMANRYRNFMNLQDSAGLDRSTGDLLQFVIEFKTGNFDAARFWAAKTYAANEQKLKSILALLADSTVSVKRAVINSIALASNDLKNTIDATTGLLSDSVQEEIWGREPFVYLPEQNLMGGDQIEKLVQFTRAPNNKYEQTVRWSDVLNDWVYVLDLTYPQSDKLYDYFGLETNIAYVESGLEIELMVESPRRLGRQLEVWVNHEQHGERYLKSAAALPLGDGWYALTVNFDDLQGEGWHIKSIRFNTAATSGEYKLSSFRFYFRTTK